MHRAPDERRERELSDLCVRLTPRIRAIAHRFGLDPNDVDDCLQEVLLDLIEVVRAGVMPAHELDRWIGVVTRNRAVDVRRAQRPPPASLMPRARTRAPDQVACERERHRDVHAAVAALPARQRACWTLRLAGWTAPQIAGALRISINAVYMRQRAAETSLANALKPYDRPER
jgi:RNA polymerase sigma factor (sigma-70 family)